MKLSFNKRTPLVLTAAVSLLLTSVGNINAAAEETLLNTLPFYKPVEPSFSPLIGELVLPQLRVNDGESLFQATLRLDWLSSQFEVVDARDIPRATETSWDEGFDQTFAKQLQELLDQIVGKYKQPGAIIRVDIDGKSWRGVAGISRYNINGDKPRVFSDKFRMGSITKMVMASLALALVQDKLLSLDDTMEKWFSKTFWYTAIPNGNLITVRDILRHQSGLADYAPVKNFVCNPLTPVFPVTDLLMPAFQLGSKFKPGTKWEYSNTNYIVLGLLIEKVTGESIIDVVNRRLLFPLEAFNTIFPDEVAIPYYYTSGYMTFKSDGGTCNATLSDNTLYDTTVFDPSLPWTAGAIITNVNDLAKIVKAQVKGTYPPLSQEWMDERFSFVKTGTSYPTYGEVTYGLGIYDINGYRGHIGQVAGFDSAAFYNDNDSGREVTVVIDMNSYPGFSDIASVNILLDIFGILDGTWTRSAPRKHYDTPDVGEV